ncbi:MAG: GH36 C-terminal domain-containing protein [Lachnospiraceae bacterium]|nr:GH36 C-terminal domain-containing protein [Lachnospiraceae bacterium]
MENIRKAALVTLVFVSLKHDFDCFEIVREDEGAALVFATQVLATPNMRSRCIPLQGLCEDAKYRIYEVSLEKEELMEDTENVVSGGILMHAGLILKRPWGDFKTQLLYLERIS